MTTTKTKPHRTPIGDYIKRKRSEAKLSLRAAAERLPFKHVYLGEIERGVHATVPRKHWPALCEAIPGITIDELDRLSTLSKPLQLDVSKAPPKYQNLGLALARRIQEQDLSDDNLNDLLDLLGVHDEFP